MPIREDDVITSQLPAVLGVERETRSGRSNAQLTFLGRPYYLFRASEVWCRRITELSSLAMAGKATNRTVFPFGVGVTLWRNVSFA